MKRAANGACSQYLKQIHGIVAGLYPSRSRGDLTNDFLPRVYLILTRQALQDPPINVRNKQRGLPSPCLNPSLSDSKYRHSAATGFQCFPLNNFKYFLTLFSKFFSSFPHGTCSLSVFRQYLAFDEIYHQFRTAIPSYSTQ